MNKTKLFALASTASLLASVVMPIAVFGVEQEQQGSLQITGAAPDFLAVPNNFTIEAFTSGEELVDDRLGRVATTSTIDPTNGFADNSLLTADPVRIGGFLAIRDLSGSATEWNLDVSTPTTTTGSVNANVLALNGDLLEDNFLLLAANAKQSLEDFGINPEGVETLFGEGATETLGTVASLGLIYSSNSINTGDGNSLVTANPSINFSSDVIETAVDACDGAEANLANYADFGTTPDPVRAIVSTPLDDCNTLTGNRLGLDAPDNSINIMTKPDTSGDPGFPFTGIVGTFMTFANGFGAFTAPDTYSIDITYTLTI
jgi:hypothetical protein